MALSNLETILVDQLELGMVVHGIAEQNGKLVVKSKGTVKHLAIINQLQSNGVISVFVERHDEAKRASNESHANTRQVTPLNTNSPLQKLKQQKQKRAKQKASQQNRVPKTFSLELEQAAALINKSHAIHKQYTQNIKKGLNIELDDARNIMCEVYDSLARNPNALLCLSLIMNHNDYLAKHAVHVAILMCYMAQRMDMSEADCERLGLLGYFFDIGMTKVPAHILSKAIALSQDEKVLVKSHVNDSLNMVKPLKLDSEILLAIEQHHERLDGSGYPNGYSGSKISKFSRMLAIADTYDALTSDRAFQQAKSPTAAMKILNTADNGYDQKLVLQFVRYLGVYPVGSLVMLSNKRIALVIENNLQKPSEPTVKVFYSAIGGHYLAPKVLNLTQYSEQIKVQKPVLASQYNLDLEKVL
ncbi:MAG: HD domain-containing phosphohydrolase [Glaciecola sp.]